MNLQLIKYLFFILTFSITSAYANGGSVVGNGAGIVESNFRYGYLLINETIPSCIDNSLCQLDPSEIVILDNIAKVIFQNKNKEDKIIFVSEKKSPGFFTTGNGSELHRIAKTGLTPEVPIYINSDLLYNDKGDALIDFSTVVGILIHELGHQAGEASDPILDNLGSKIRFFLNSRLSSYTLSINNDPSLSLSVLIINSEFPIKRAHVFLNWNQGKRIEISDIIRSKIKCKNDNDYSVGFEVENGYFSREITNNVITFNGWIKNYCNNDMNESSIKIETQDLRVQIVYPNLDILELDVK